MVTTTDLRERLAELEHEQWALWTRWLIDHISPEMVARWERQIATPYDRLSEPEKESDREWADKVLAIVEAEPPAVRARLSAAEAVVEAVRIYHRSAPGSDVWDAYDRRVGEALAAYDALTASTPDAAGEGGAGGS